MTTLITGVGAVGAHVAANLQEKREPLVFYDISPKTEFLRTLVDLDRAKVVVGDVNDIPKLQATIENEGVDRIIHLAGFLHKEIRDQPFAGIKLNILGTGSVLEAARLTGVQRVVLASTRGVNNFAPPPKVGKALDEDFEMRVLTNRPKTIYEVSKFTGEHIGLIYNDSYGVDFAAIRLGGGFGPTPAAPKGMTGGVLWHLVYNAALGRPVVVEDPALTYAGRHEFVYFKDDAEAIVLAAFKNDLKKRVYNVRMDDAYEYLEVVDTVRKVFPGAQIEVKTVSKMSISPGHKPRDDFADTTAAREELGWKPKYTFEEGIREWGEWIRKTEGRTY